MARTSCRVPLAFSVILLVAVVSVICSGGATPNVDATGRSFRVEELAKHLGGFEQTVEINEQDKSKTMLEESSLRNIFKSSEKSDESSSSTARRKRRQVSGVNEIDVSVFQNCEGITLQWVTPNIPLSNAFHSSNPEFSHYNIYRETYTFSTVAGLKPIASGTDDPRLKNLHLNKWTDKFPPTGVGLFYAITLVNHKGEETQRVTPKQLSFIGTFQGDSGLPARIIPNIVKGNVIHHSVAYNEFRNEYFVAFDIDNNNDNTPDRVYGLRINGLGQILGGNIIDFTLAGVTNEQGHPTVAFNPSNQEYLVAFHISALSLQGGKHVIIGQRVYGHATTRNGNPFLILKGQTKNGFASVIEPKLMYNSGSGGYVMTAMLIEPPKTLFTVFIKPDGKVSSFARLFSGEVFEASLFMDTKYQQVYIVFQIQQHAATLTNKNDRLPHRPYLIIVSKANSTGALLKLGGNSERYLVGPTSEKNANIAGYFDEKNGWLAVFWNNRENNRKVISSTIFFGIPGTSQRVVNAQNCSTHVNVENAVTCYLPANNYHIMIWEKGSRIGGDLLKDGTFDPVHGTQRRAKIVYNKRESKVLVVYQQVVGGVRVVFVRKVAPSSQPSCRRGCQSSERCAMKDVCVPHNPVAVHNAPTCVKANGGCSHTCTSLAKGRTCSCPLSYTLALDGMKCFLTATKPDVSLLYSSKGSIWSLSVYYTEKRVSFARIPIQGKFIISFFYNHKDKYLYWSDSTEQKIYRSHLDGTNQQLIVSGNQVALPDGMIVDPDAKRLYWTEGISGTVFRCLLDGANLASFITGLDKPRTLALHQKKKLLFWTSWGAVAKIERINTDGSNRMEVISTGIRWPNGLTHDGKYLYWADAHFDKIERSDLNGNGRIVVTTNGVLHPYGLGIAGHRLYWTDWTGHIRSADKRKARLAPDEIAFGIEKPFSLQIYDGTALKASFCNDPGVPPFGGRNPPPTQAGRKYDVGDRIMLTCNPGFVHLGSHSRQCLPTGKWSGSTTQCKVLPVFTKMPSNKTADLSYFVAIECSADSKSRNKATIKWYKDGKVLGPSGRYYKDRVTGYLHIPSVLIDDEGRYTCEASNAAGKIQASMYLTVRQKQIACGKAKFATLAKIIGGQRAARGSIPWQILLFNNVTKRPFCGATLLNERWAVTAAHCLTETLVKIQNVVAILGEHRWNKTDKTEQFMSINDMHFHPQYDTTTYDSDIALLKFARRAIYTDYVVPVCLPTSASDFALSKAGNTGRASGWGARKANKTNSARTLHQVNIPTVDHTACVRNHAPTYVVTANMLCAGRLNEKDDACKGDSGGPFTVKNAGTGKEVLVGLVSWGDRCGKKDKYGVYTKVQNFLAWIHSYITKI